MTNIDNRIIQLKKQIDFSTRILEMCIDNKDSDWSINHQKELLQKRRLEYYQLQSKKWLV